MFACSWKTAGAAYAIVLVVTLLLQAIDAVPEPVGESNARMIPDRFAQILFLV